MTLLTRRHLLAALAAAPVCARAALRQRVTLGAAWRGPAADDAQQIGLLDVDWTRRSITIRRAVTLPSRAHGLLADGDGAVIGMAARPGRWLLRMDPDGRVARQQTIEGEGRSFDGHVIASADGRWLYTGETDAHGQGWLSVRERTSFRKADEWRTHGIDPHQMVLDAQGQLLLANGGIARTADGRKRDLDRMRSSLVRLDHRDGTLLGQWTLDDARLSLRHLAWSDDGRRLGIALQAEHDDTAARARAPLLATFDGERLALPGAEAQGEGYAGDIAAVPAGGFAVSAQRAKRGLAWWPQRGSAMARFAEVEEPCALAADIDGALLMACGAGLARWHPTEGAAMLRWPQPMALDNHWVVV